MSPMWITMLIPNMASGMVSMELGTRGPAAASCTACAASSMAIGDAASYIRDNRCDAMIVGGTEAPITQRRHRRLLRDARDLDARGRSRGARAGRSTSSATASWSARARRSS